MEFFFPIIGNESYQNQSQQAILSIVCKEIQLWVNDPYHRFSI
jgi:hypothetical protein